MAMSPRESQTHLPGRFTSQAQQLQATGELNHKIGVVSASKMFKIFKAKFMLVQKYFEVYSCNRS